MASPSPQNSPMPPPQAPSPMGPPSQSPAAPPSPHSPYQGSSTHLNGSQTQNILVNHQSSPSPVHHSVNHSSHVSANLSTQSHSGSAISNQAHTNSSQTNSSASHNQSSSNQGHSLQQPGSQVQGSSQNNICNPIYSNVSTGVTTLNVAGQTFPGPQQGQVCYMHKLFN